MNSRPKRDSSRLRRRAAALSVLALAAAALYPTASQATVTFGSDLSLPPTSTSSNCVLSTPPCTHLGGGVHDGNAFPAESPVSGVVVRFGLKTGVLSGANETVTFRLIRPDTEFGGAAVGVATGPTVAVHEPGVYSFPANVPVKIGNSLGIDTTSTRAISDPDTPGACFEGSYFLTYHPVLANGGPFQAPDSNSVCELLINAVVEPSNAFSVANGKRNRKKGTAALLVDVANPGKLTLTGKGVKTATKSVGAADLTTLLIRATGKKKRRLNKTGKVKLQAKVTYKPMGGALSTQSRKLKLKKR